jgi:2-polyprenyl-6-methoxyphenol hydroxylase-like FAD-dependent oxidoreductase
VGKRWDVVVVGGGPAGSVCAASLARRGWQVLLAEAGDFSKPRPAETLGPAAVRLLERLAWVKRDDTAGVCRGVLAKWGAAEAEVRDYELEQCEAGWIVRRPEIDRLLFARAGCVGVATRLRWRCLGVRVDGTDTVSVEFSTPAGAHQEAARFVVEATGRHPMGGGASRVHLDRQVAYFTTVGAALETHDLLWVESAEAGWWYLIGLSGGAQLVFVTEARPRSAGPGARVAFFEEQFERTRLLRPLFPEPPRFEAIRACDARAARPGHAPPDRVLRIGDAAGSADPLSGQGWAQALESALAGADVVSGCLVGAGSLDRAAFERSAAARHDHHLETRASLWSLALRP